MLCKRASDKQLKKFIHSANLRFGGRKINTNLMRGSKTNSTVVLSTQTSWERRGRKVERNKRGNRKMGGKQPVKKDREMRKPKINEIGR